MTTLPTLVRHCTLANGTWIQFITQRCPSDEYLLRRMSHILLGERAWFQRIAGEEPSRAIWELMAVPRLQELHTEHQATYADLMNSDLQRVIKYARFTGESYQSPVADILLHLVLHGTHHRGQMATHASASGVTPVNTDFIEFCRVHQL